MEELDLPEESLRMLESRIGMRITIIDNDGIFNCKQRRRVFSEERASHKKNPVCLCGFSEKCIAHCRYAMNRKCLESDSAFFSSCWKGICQIVVPLTFASVHYGMLYAGTFRSSDPPRYRSSTCRQHRAPACFYNIGHRPYASPCRSCSSPAAEILCRERHDQWLYSLSAVRDCLKH